MIVRTILLAVSLALPPAAFSDTDAPEWVDEARRKSAQLGSGLTDALREALVSRGPSGGVEVCNIRAPEIAGRISDDRIEVGRTALRVRNPANAPDAWEREVLERFKSELANGADPASLEAWTTVETDGRPRGRWMKAIPTAALCTTCHGEQIAPELARTINRIYPDDQAIGFRPGELRGAFTATIELAGHDQSRSDSD